MPATTVMRDSVVGDQWIQEMCRLNPVSRIVGDDGLPNGNILTGPVRLAFCDSLFDAKPKMKSDPNSKLGFGCTVLFTPYADMTIFWEEYYRICAADFSQFYNPAGQSYNVDNPIYDQGTKSQYGGFTTGCWATNTSSNYKPPIVDMRNNPITDPSKVYPGVWALVAVNPYASGKGKPKKGPRFGLQTIMVIADDTPLAGGAPDPRAQFRGVQVKPPVGVPSAAFGQPVAPPPGAGGVAAYYPPSGIARPPSAPVGMAPPPGAVPAYTPGFLPPPPGGSGDDEDLTQFT